VLQVIEAVERVTGMRVAYRLGSVVLAIRLRWLQMLAVSRLSIHGPRATPTWTLSYEALGSGDRNVCLLRSDTSLHRLALDGRSESGPARWQSQ
jgi:hypothetical protein